MSRDEHDDWTSSDAKYTLRHQHPHRYEYQSFIVANALINIYLHIDMCTYRKEENIDGLVQEFSFSIASALVILQSCTQPSICVGSLCSYGKITKRCESENSSITSNGQISYSHMDNHNRWELFTFSVINFRTSVDATYFITVAHVSCISVITSSTLSFTLDSTVTE